MQKSQGRVGAYQARNEIAFTVPGDARDLRLWMVLPQEDSQQIVKNLNVSAPFPWHKSRDSEGNDVLYLEAKAPIPASFKVVTTFEVDRAEQRARIEPAATRPLDEHEILEHRHELSPNQYIVIDEKIRALAREITGGERNPIVASRKIYDWVLNNIDYWVKDPNNKKASPQGSSEYCLATRTGNCTDFHSLYAALSRASNIPTRILFGSLLKKELDGQDVDQSYHCWIEFLAPNIGWVPLDVAVADIYAGGFQINSDNDEKVRRTTPDGYTGPDPAKVNYYFGNLEERRVLWSVGRDLKLDPAPKAGAVQAMPKAYVEVDGQPLAEKTGWTRKFTYKELK